MAEPLRWGILGTGGIARKFAGQLQQCGRARLVGVGSRSIDRARNFAERFGGEAHRYDGLIWAADVEAVYVSLPNSLHHEWTLRALRAGKHVLCEKPIAASAEQAEEMFDVADREGRVLVEAFMYRCYPAVRKLIRMVREGAVGRVKLIRTHFTFRRPDAPDDVRYQPQLAGGSLMDVGCYCVNLARALAGGEPTDVHAVAHRHESGVDDYAAGLLSFGGQLLAVFTCGMTVEADRTTFVGGSDGYLTIDLPWFSDGSFQLVRGQQRETVVQPAPLEPYALEADTFASVVQAGAEPWITPSDSIGNMRVLDQLRQQVGGRR